MNNTSNINSSLFTFESTNLNVENTSGNPNSAIEHIGERHGVALPSFPPAVSVDASNGFQIPEFTDSGYFNLITTNTGLGQVTMDNFMEPYQLNGKIRVHLVVIKTETGPDQLIDPSGNDFYRKDGTSLGMTAHLLPNTVYFVFRLMTIKGWVVSTSSPDLGSNPYPVPTIVDVTNGYNVPNATSNGLL